MVRLIPLAYDPPVGVGRGFNSLNGAINTDINVEEISGFKRFQFLKWCD